MTISWSLSKRQENSLQKSSHGVVRASLDLWIVSCLEKIPKGRFPTHAHLDKVLKWIDDLQPKRAILTHMGPQLDYDDLMKILPAHVIPAHDHLVVTV